MISKFIYVIILFLFSNSLFAQKDHSFYLRANTISWQPQVYIKNGILIYEGEDEVMQDLFSEYRITIFVKAFSLVENPLLKKTWLVRAESEEVFHSFIQDASHLFEFGEYIGVYDFNTFSYIPNDYGTSTPSPYVNLGAPLNNNNYDYLNVPDAWDITTGNDNVYMAIADTYPFPNSDINNKITYSTFRNAWMDSQNPIFPSYDQLSPGNWAFHGTAVMEYAAGQINNGFGLSGICADCPIYGMFRRSVIHYDEMLTLVHTRPGDRFVFNFSGWDSIHPIQTHHLAIQEIVDNKGIIVAAAHNFGWNLYPGNRFHYPASYPEVISVSSVGHKKRDEILFQDPNSPGGSTWSSRSVENIVAGSVHYTNNDPVNGDAVPYDSSTTILNHEVDILAPGFEVPLFGRWVENGSIIGTINSTSYAAPQVTGTVGLMLSVNDCLEYEEVMSILKLTSTNIDHIPANQRYLDNYGSGGMNTFRAVNMAEKMNSVNSSETIVVENQDFHRWDFILKSSPFDIDIKNQIFRDTVTVDFTAKNSIELLEGTVLEPTHNGFMLFEINANLGCYTSTNRIKKLESEKINKVEENIAEIIIFPNPADSGFSIMSEIAIQEITIYTIDGKEVYRDSFDSVVEVNNINYYKNGIYIVRFVLSNGMKTSRKLIVE